MRIYHSRFDILVAEEALHLSDVYTVLEQVSSETVPEGVDSSVLCDTGLPQRISECKLNRFIADMMSSNPSASGVYRRPG